MAVLCLHRDIRNVLALCGLNIGYVNHVACRVERSCNRHLFALELLRILLIIEEVSSRFALGRLTREQGELPVCEFYDLAGKCLTCCWICLLGLWLPRLLLLSRLLLGLLRLLLLLGVAATLSSQARGGNAEG